MCFSQFKINSLSCAVGYFQYCHYGDIAITVFGSHTHGLYRRVRQTASSMDAAMGKRPNSGCADFVAPITWPWCADVDDDLALAGCLFPL